MIYLQDWYIASANRLRCEDAAAFLGVCSAIDSGQAETTKLALDEIAERSRWDSNLRFALLPRLISLSMSNETARAIVVNDLLADQPSTGRILSLIIKRQWKDAVDNVRSLCVMMGSSGTVEREDYTRFDESVPALCALSFLRILPSDEASELYDDEDFSAFFEQAADGGNGRLCLTLALRIGVDLGLMEPHAALKKLRKAVPLYYREPDLAELAIGIQFRGISPDAIIDMLENKQGLKEAMGICGVDLRKMDADESFWTNSPGDPKSCVRQICLMWSYVMEMEALRSASREGLADALSRRLCDAWRNSLEERSKPNGLPLPWMRRGTLVYDKSKGKAELEYPLMVAQAEVAKAAFGVPLIEGMVCALRGDIPPFFSDLLLNLSDAFGTAFVRVGCEDFAERYYSNPMIALLAYGREVLDCIGKGYLNDEIPAAYAQRVRNISLPVLDGGNVNEPDQIIMLHSGASIMACSRLAYEELSGAFPEGRHWLKEEDGASPAAFVCSVALNQWRRFIESSSEYRSLGINPIDIMSSPLSLAYERYPKLLSENKWDCGNVLCELLDANRPDADGRQRRLNISKVSPQRWLMRRFDLDEWLELDYDDSPECWVEKLSPASDGNYPKALFALTCKLRSALKVESPFLDPNACSLLDQILPLWASRIALISNARQCSRSIRFELVEALADMLRPDVFASFFARQGEPERDASHDVRDIAQLVIETVLDASKNTPFYAHKLSQQLLSAAGNASSNKTAQFLLGVFFHCLYMQDDSEQLGPDRIEHPYTLMEQEENRIRKDTLLRRFLADVGGTCPPIAGFRQTVEERLISSGVESGNLIIQSDRISIACRDFTGDAAMMLWDPDTLAFNDGTTIEHVFYQKYQGRLQPVERGFVELLAEEAFAGSNGKIRLVLIDHGRMLFSVRPGYNYVLPKCCWNPVDYSKLAEAVGRNTLDSPNGIILVAKVVVSTNGEPLLILCDEPSLDNIDYRHLFSEGDAVEVMQKNGLLVCRHDFCVSGHSSELSINVNTAGSSAGWQVVREDGWGIVAQRTRTLSTELPKTYCVQPGSEGDAECIKRFTSLKHGTVISLRGGQRFACAERQSERVWTRENIPVRLASESIAPIPNAAIRLRGDALAVVATAAYVRGANGIIWSYTLEQSMIPVEIRYLDERGAVRSIHRKIDELGASPRDLWAGLPVIVNTATERVEFASRPRPLVRRLWRLGDEREANLRSGKHLRAINPEDGSDAIVCASANEGKLVLVHELIDSSSILEARAGTVSRVATFRSDDGYRDAIRYTEYDGEGGVLTLYGESDAGSFADVDRCSNLVAILDTIEYDGRVLYDIHLMFEPLERGGSQDEPHAHQEAMSVRSIRYAEEYEEWLNRPEWAPNGAQHVEGVLDFSLPTPCLHPAKPIGWLPENPSKEICEDRASWRWVDRIPITSESKDHVTGNGPAFAYAKIVELEDGRTAADLVETASFSAKRFKRWLAQNPRWNSGASSYNLALTVVDYREGSFLFTWAPGFVLSIPGWRVTIDGKAALVNQLFYGDRFSRFGLIAKDSVLHLVLSMENLTPSLDKLVMRDANMGIVPLVQVRYDADSDAVSISRVSVSRQQSQAGGERWRFREYTTGILDEETENFVRTLLPEGGEGSILAVPERERDELVIRFKRKSFYDLNQGDVLCMSGGSIRQTRTKNDYLVPLSPGGDGTPALICENGERINLVLKRRDFSLNENALRVQYSADPDAFKFNLLVSVVRLKDGTIGASLTNMRFRKDEDVSRWLFRFGPQNVTVARPTSQGDGFVRVEIKPGVLCRAREVNWSNIKTGGTYFGKLFLDDKRQLCVEPLSESDNDYLVEGRIAEMLIKDNGKGFTFAGFPQVSLGDDDAIAAKRRFEPPRWVEIGQRSPNGMPTIRESNPRLTFGYLRAEFDNEKNRKRIVLFRGKDEKKGREPQRSIKYHMLSYLEGSFNDLWKSISKSHWHYHDQTYLSSRGERTDYGENCALPLVFTDSMGLRYKEDELARHAFPPHELEEYGLPGDAEGAWLPVAGSDSDAVFVELSPGRIMKVLSKRLSIGGQPSSGVLYPGFFAPGDRLLFGVRKAEPGQAAKIELNAVSYGMRGWAEDRMVLPFQPEKSGQGLLIFGAGPCTVRLPSFLKFDDSSVAVIHRDTNAMEWNGVSLQAGDTVLVHMGGESLGIAGFESMSIESVGSYLPDPDQAWLREIIEQPMGFNALIGLLGGTVPVHIVSVEGDSVRLELRQPPAPPDESVLAMSPVGNDRGQHLILRCGSRLFLADMSSILGVPAALAQAIVSATDFSGKTLWFRWGQQDDSECGALRSGMYDSANAKRTVRVLSAVDSDSGSGFLCIDTCNGELLWMPLSECCLAATASARSVFEILRERGVLNVAMLGSFVSYLRANVLFQRDLDDMVKHGRARTTRVFLSSCIESNPRVRKYVYLCYEMPCGNIFELISEVDLRVSSAVDACFRSNGDGQSYYFVPCDQWRTAIALSYRTLAFIDGAYKASPDLQLKTIKRELVRSQYDTVVQMVRDSWTNAAFCRTDAEANIIGLTRSIHRFREAGYSEHEPSFAQALSELPDAVRDYVRHLQETDVSQGSVTVVSLICFMLMLNELGRETDAADLLESIKGRLWNWAVEEYLLNRWLLDQDPISKYDLRQLLSTLPLGGCECGEGFKRLSTMAGTLTEHQRVKLAEICRLVLRRRRGLSGDLHSCLALCLLSASGQISTNLRDILAGALEETSVYGLASACAFNDFVDGALLDRLVDSCPGLSFDDANSGGLISEILNYPSIRSLLAG